MEDIDEEENTTEAQMHLERLKKNLKVISQEVRKWTVQYQLKIYSPDLILLSNTIFASKRDKYGYGTSMPW